MKKATNHMLKKIENKKEELHKHMIEDQLKSKDEEEQDNSPGMSAAKKLMQRAPDSRIVMQA